jgi:excisionase family DNA binding protein
MEPNNTLLTKEQVAQLLNVSVRTVERMREREQIPSVKIGRSVRFPRAGVLQLMQRGTPDELTTTTTTYILPGSTQEYITDFVQRYNGDDPNDPFEIY